MNKLEWKDSYCIFIDEIDNQHRHLFEIYNNLVEKIDSNNNSKIIIDTLTEMTHYANYHFETEEKYMEKYGFPESDEHKKEHISFIKNISRLNLSAMENNNNLSEDVLEYLGQWLLSHILDSDMKLKTFFNNKKQNPSPLQVKKIKKSSSEKLKII